MNDRLMIAAMLMAGDAASGEGWGYDPLPGSMSRRAELMIRLADALIAAAGEQEGVAEFNADRARAESADRERDAAIARAEAAEAKVARLERQSEPLTEDEAIRVLGCSAIPGMCGADVMKMVGFADRIRARRSE